MNPYVTYTYYCKDCGKEIIRHRKASKQPVCSKCKTIHYQESVRKRNAKKRDDTLMAFLEWIQERQLDFGYQHDLDRILMAYHRKENS